jgi:hypothetical protein
MTEDDQPSGARTLAGCAAAVLVGAVSAGVATWWQLSAGASGAPGLLVVTLLVAMPIAAAHALALGLPFYLLLRRWWRLRWWSAALGGFVVAVVPAGLMSFLPANNISLAAVRELAEFGLYGLAGVLAFWIVLRDPPSHTF